MADSYKVQTRLKGDAAIWFVQRLADSKRTPSELLAEIVTERMDWENRPFGFYAKKLSEGPVKKTPEGYTTMIPDFAARPIGGTIQK